MEEVNVLGIETSCDDTSIAVIRGLPGYQHTSTPKLLTHQVFSQEKILAPWGGVIPEIAARNHLEKITPLLNHVFQEAKLDLEDIDLISVTTHPGLLGPLLTGLNAAKSLCLLAQKPLLPVNHLYAHIEAIHLTEKIQYPYLGVLVSGGHSLFLLFKNSNEIDILGSTIDDAAGEAFDKGGKLMGLGYPAGKIIDEQAKQGDSSRFNFPIGLKDQKDAMMSFSGLKTSLRQLLEKNPQLKETETLPDLCASYQKAIVDAIEIKLAFAIEKAKSLTNNPLPIVLGGGVACNSGLRERLSEKYPDIKIVKPVFCTDNGAMIANYGLRHLSRGIPFPKCLDVDAKGRFIDKKQYQKQSL